MHFETTGFYYHIEGQNLVEQNSQDVSNVSWQKYLSTKSWFLELQNWKFLVKGSTRLYFNTLSTSLGMYHLTRHFTFRMSSRLISPKNLNFTQMTRCDLVLMHCLPVFLFSHAEVFHNWGLTTTRITQRMSAVYNWFYHIINDFGYLFHPTPPKQRIPILLKHL